MRIIIFNILIVFFLIIAVFFPLILLGQAQTAELLKTAWPLGIVAAAALAVINTVFFLNRKLLALLEGEDWPALTAYLEQKVYQEGRYSPRLVKLLAQSCLATGNFDGVVNLKNRVAAVKPALIEHNALIFGAAYLLGGNTAATVEFFRERLQTEKPGAWLRWYYGFSLLLDGVYEQAGIIFQELAADVKDILVAGLSAFFLSELARKSPAAPAEWRVCAEEGKSGLRKAVQTAQKWAKKAEKLKAEVHGAVIRGYVDRAGAWIWENN